MRVGGCAAVLVALALLPACGGGDGDGQGSAAPPVATPETTAEMSPNMTPSDGADGGVTSSSSSSSQSHNDEGPSPSSVDGLSTPTDAPVALEPEGAPQRVSLEQFFKPADTWRESTFQVADLSDVAGLASPVSNCGFDTYSDPPNLDLRLQNRFSELTFTVAQENFSEVTDQVLVVEVSTDSRQTAVQRVTYNEFAPVVVNVTDVGVVNIRLALDDQAEDCDGEVTGVLYDVMLD